MASATDRDVKGGDKTDVGANTPTSGAKAGPTSRKNRSSAKKGSEVSNALRTVYQRAVEEDIPAEMLDLLRKLD